MTAAVAAIKKMAARQGPISHIRELVLIVGAYFVYMFVRKLIFSGGGEDIAFSNALKIISFESAWGVFWEPVWQEGALNIGHWVVILFNWLYIITYWPVILTTALIFYLIDRHRYFYYRSIILLSFVAALIIFALFPLAPPRIIEGHNFVDSIQVFGPVWYGSREMASYYNAFAAMPSLHFAWTVVFGFLFFRSRSRWLKVLGVLYPIVTFFAITITANHYIVDAVIGALMMLVVYLIYEVFFNRRYILRAGIFRLKGYLNLPGQLVKRGGNS